MPTLILLLLCLLVPLWGCSTPTGTSKETIPSSSPVAEAQRSFAFVDQITVQVQESQPLQVKLKVTGTLPDGCDVPLEVEQERRENEVEVELYRLLPPDMMCPMVVVPFEKEIQLEGTFDPGSYQFRVNEKRVEQDI